MRYRLLGKTCAKVSEIGFGGRAIGSDAYGSTNEDDAVLALQTAYDSGCNLFDTSDAYDGGRGERLLAKALGSHRKGFLAATKVGRDPSSGNPMTSLDRNGLVAAAERSLGRLATDYIDLYQLDSPTLDLIRSDEIHQAFDELKGSGKIRWSGASVDSPEEALAAIETGRFECIQVRFHLADRSMFSKVFPAAKKERVALIVREVLAGGLLSGRYPASHRFPEGDVRGDAPQELVAEAARIATAAESLLSESTETRVQLALKYALAFDAVSSVLVGVKNERQLEDALEAAIGDPISREEFEGLGKILEPR